MRAALQELKDELAKVRTILEAKRRATNLPTGVEDLVTRTRDAFRTLAIVLGDKTFSLERRREVRHGLLPKSAAVGEVRSPGEERLQLPGGDPIGERVLRLAAAVRGSAALAGTHALLIAAAPPGELGEHNSRLHSVAPARRSPPEASRASKKRA